MNKIFYICTFLCVIYVQVTYAENYGSKGRSGDIQITENLNDVPVDHRAGSVSKREIQKVEVQNAAATSRDKISENCRIELEDHLRGCRRYFQQGLSVTEIEVKPEQVLVMAYRNCSHPLLQDRLTSEEKAKLGIMAKQVQEAEQKLTKKELDDIKIVTAYYYSPCRRTYTLEDKDELLPQFQQAWQAMADALETNDIEKVVSFWHPSVRDVMRKSFLQYSEEKCKRTANDMRKDRIVIDSIEDGVIINCRNIATREGKQYSSKLKFVQGLDGEWLIGL